MSERLVLLGISASPRKGGNSETVLDEALRSAEGFDGATVETERFTLAGTRLSPCLACYGCIDAQGECVIPDGFQALRDAWLRADAILYSIPVFAMSIPGQLKCFFDRLANSLIFDAFARIDPADPLIVCWPDVQLDAAQAALLDALLDATGYLGRAESWLQARRLPDWDGEPNCAPGEQVVVTATGELRGEVVSLQLPRGRADYAAFRAHLLEGLAARDLKPKERRQIEASLPEDWLAALSVETGELQAAGWSAHPAARRQGYLRPLDSLRVQAETARVAKRPGRAVTSVRYALYGKPLPRGEDALKVGEWLRRAAMGSAKRLLGADAIPALISGHDLPAGNRHRHAFYLPEINPQSGRIDHVTLHLPDAMEAECRRALEGLHRLFGRDGQQWRLLREHSGLAEAFAAHSALFGRSQVWESQTPYLHPWHAKRDFGAEEQIRRECRQRGLPQPQRIERLPAVQVGSRERRAIHFARFRDKRGLHQPDRHGGFFRLHFADEIDGPLALGFACHYGLGLFCRVQ